jgi:hypothetical protein
MPDRDYIPSLGPPCGDLLLPVTGSDFHEDEALQQIDLTICPHKINII